MDVLSQLIAISGLHLAVAMTPGPNTLAVCCISSAGTRRDGLSVAAGIVTATGIWVTVALFGAGAIMAQSGQIITILRVAAALYLVWIGLRMLAAPPVGVAPVIGRRPYLLGLLTALANPFSIAFWLGTFLSAIPATASELLYAEIFALVTIQSTLWYSLLAILFSSAMRGKTFAAARTFRCITAVALIVIGMNGLYSV